jgi:hypothetical protein
MTAVYEHSAQAAVDEVCQHMHELLFLNAFGVLACCDPGFA